MNALTARQTAEARQAYGRGGVSAVTLAARYGVSERTMYRALKGVHRPPIADRDGMAWSGRAGPDPAP